MQLSINTSALPANTTASTPSLLHLITAAPSEMACPVWRFLDTKSLSDFILSQKSPLQHSIQRYFIQLHYHPIVLLPTSCPSSPFCIFLMPLSFLQHCPFSPQIAALLVCHWKQTSCGSLSHQLLISSNLKCNLKSLYFLQTINFSLLTLL